MTSGTPLSEGPPSSPGPETGQVTLSCLQSQRGLFGELPGVGLTLRRQPVPTSCSQHPLPSADPAQGSALRAGGGGGEYSGKEDVIMAGQENALSRLWSRQQDHCQSSLPNWDFPVTQIAVARQLLNSAETSSLSLPICEMGAKDDRLYLNGYYPLSKTRAHLSPAATSADGQPSFLLCPVWAHRRHCACHPVDGGTHRARSQS